MLGFKEKMPDFLKYIEQNYDFQDQAKLESNARALELGILDSY